MNSERILDQAKQACLCPDVTKVCERHLLAAIDAAVAEARKAQWRETSGAVKEQEAMLIAVEQDRDQQRTRADELEATLKSCQESHGSVHGIDWANWRLADKRAAALKARVQELVEINDSHREAHGRQDRRILGLERDRDEWRGGHDQMKRERDIFERERDDLQHDFDSDHRKVLADDGAHDEQHCSCVPHLRRAVEQLRAERNEYHMLYKAAGSACATVREECDRLRRALEVE